MENHYGGALFPGPFLILVNIQGGVSYGATQLNKKSPRKEQGMRKLIIVILLVTVLIFGGLGGFAYAQVNGHEPMTGHKLISWGEMGTLPSGDQVSFFAWFTNPDCVSDITIDRISIIRSDGEVIFEGKPSELPPFGPPVPPPPFPDVLGPYQTLKLAPIFCYIPDGSGGWLSPEEGLALPASIYTLEIFYSVSPKDGLPLIGEIVGDGSSRPMADMEQVLEPEKTK